MSTTVHRDEQTPHMHLIFLPVVHTTDKKGNPIEKLACSEFWKAKDSYRQLQDAFYNYTVANGFNLQRGLPKEETNREHYSAHEYKKITNFKQTKEILKNMKLELPDVPEIDDIKIARWSKKRDEKILEDIIRTSPTKAIKDCKWVPENLFTYVIKPKDDLINKLYQDNWLMHQQLLKQEKMVENATKYEKERNKIIEDNGNLHNEVEQIKKEYKQKEFDLEWQYKSKIKGLEKENNKLHRIIDKFHDTIDKFIHWICKKFDMGSEDNLVRDFERESHILLDAEKQLKREDREKEWKLEI